MIDRTVLTTLLLLLASAVVKAHWGGLKLLLLAGAGIAGLYMVHLLAQDYNKYQANRPSRGFGLVSGLISKRSIPDDVSFGSDYSYEESYNDHISQNYLPSLETVLRFDPMGCARRYVCTIATKSSKKMTNSEINIFQMFRHLPRTGRADSGQEAFRAALDLGRRTRDPEACKTEYPKCIFSIPEMLKLIGAT